MSKTDALRALREQRYARIFGPAQRIAATADRSRSTGPVASVHRLDPPAPIAPSIPVPAVRLDPVESTPTNPTPRPHDRTPGDGMGRGMRPDLTPGRSIQSYKDEDLRMLIDWINSDGVARDEQALLDAVMKELGFTRRGKNIKARVAAIAAA